MVIRRRLAPLLMSILSVPLLVTQSAADPVQLYPPSFVVPPPTLLGDAGDGRCPTPTEKCYQDVDDPLYGQTHLMREDDVVFAFRNGYALLSSESSTLTGPGSQQFTLNDGSVRYSAPAVVGARMFDTPSDVAVTAVSDSQQGVINWRLDGLWDVQHGANPALTLSGTVSGFPFFPPLVDNLVDGLLIVATDMTGDGFDEIVIFPGTTSGVVGAVVGSAVNTADPSQGLRFGPVFDLFDVSATFSSFAMAAASVQGQPRILVAGTISNSTGCIANAAAGLALNSYSVDKNTLALSVQGSFAPTLPGSDNQCLQSIDITRGRFSTPLRDQLLVSYAREGGTVKLLPIDVNDQGAMVQQPVYDSGVIIGGGWAGIQAGRLNWGAPVDQAVLFISNNLGDPNLNSLRILIFDQNFNPHVESLKQGTGASNECAEDFILGNFDRQDPAPNPPLPDGALYNPNLQIATLTSDCGNISALRIWDVDPLTFAITKHGNDFNYSNGTALSSAIAPVDLQGRSYRVGPPAIVTVEQTQPSVILAAVPMHIDAVVPAGAGGPVAITNISGMAPGLETSFVFASSTSTSTTSTFSNSATFSGQEKGEGHESLGDCDEGPCESVQLRASFSQKIASSSGSTQGVFNSVNQDLKIATGFQDSVTYESSTLSIYVYPVLGQMVCPSSLPGCADSEKVPLRASLAGPDTVRQVLNAPGGALTWYQPVWMPGHILSYPGSAGQLQLATSGSDAFQDFADANPITLATSGTLSSQTTWTGGGTNGSSSGVNRDFSYEAGLSVVYQVSYADVLNIGGSLDLDFGESTSFSGLTEVNKSVDATQGIGFNQSANLTNPEYLYTLTPHIFGKKRPVASVSDINDSTTSEDLKVFGALRTAYEVDVTESDGSGGKFWGDWYGQAPDVALNQPNHWQLNLDTSDPKDGSCLVFSSGSSDVDCASLGARLPGDKPIWDSDYHTMRGLFISSSVGGQGPQVTSATSGDLLTLSARVYNLSLSAFPAGTTVHVRFMGMPWDTGNSTQATEIDPSSGQTVVIPSFLIDEAILTGDQLPPHNSDTGSATPNWALASATFDTGSTNCGGRSCDNQDLLFWVVVWAQTPGSAPTLVAELAQHGLASMPASGEDFLQVAQLEQPFSNNLGLYDQVFHIFPKVSALRAPTPDEGEIGARITGVGTSVRELERGGALALVARVGTGGRDLQSGLAVDFYDGDPGAGGQLVGLQRLPFLSADSEYEYRIRFRPHACGVHTIYAAAGQGTRHGHLARFRPIEVKCPDAAKLSARVVAKTGAQAARQWTVLVSNTGAATAGNARIDAFKLTQTGGAACTPTVFSPSAFPLEVGDIAAGGSANAFVTINFGACAPTARFRADLAFSSNSGIVPGTTVLNNQFR